MAEGECFRNLFGNNLFLPLHLAPFVGSSFSFIFTAHVSCLNFFAICNFGMECFLTFYLSKSHLKFQNSLDKLGFVFLNANTSTNSVKRRLTHQNDGLLECVDLSPPGTPFTRPLSLQPFIPPFPPM